MSIIGYARVSTQDQDLSAQLAALKTAGASTVYREKISGVRADRPQLKKMVAALKRGDLVIVTRLDRLGRSVRELLSSPSSTRSALASAPWPMFGAIPPRRTGGSCSPCSAAWPSSS